MFLMYATAMASRITLPSRLAMASRDDTNPSRAAMHNAIVRGFSSSRDWEQIAKSCLALNFGQTPSGKHTKSYGKSLFLILNG